MIPESWYLLIWLLFWISNAQGCGKEKFLSSEGDGAVQQTAQVRAEESKICTHGAGILPIRRGAAHEVRKEAECAPKVLRRGTVTREQWAKRCAKRRAEVRERTILGAKTRQK